ncbi:MAG: hypothetical protein IJ189_04745 [Clostridia bacterium]|nr:hypothetical protein [Clostridia bacterium]
MYLAHVTTLPFVLVSREDTGIYIQCNIIPDEIPFCKCLTMKQSLTSAKKIIKEYFPATNLSDIAKKAVLNQQID